MDSLQEYKWPFSESEMFSIGGTEQLTQEWLFITPRTADD